MNGFDDLSLLISNDRSIELNFPTLVPYGIGWHQRLATFSGSGTHYFWNGHYAIHSLEYGKQVGIAVNGHITNIDEYPFFLFYIQLKEVISRDMQRNAEKDRVCNELGGRKELGLGLKEKVESTTSG